MEPQVLALMLVGYPPRDAAGAGEGTKAASAGGTQGRSCEQGTPQELSAPLKPGLSENKPGNRALQRGVNSFHAKTLSYIAMRNYRARLFPWSKALVM